MLKPDRASAKDAPAVIQWYMNFHIREERVIWRHERSSHSPILPNPMA